MQKTLRLSCALLSIAGTAIAGHAMAQELPSQSTIQTSTGQSMPAAAPAQADQGEPVPQPDPVMTQIQYLQAEWARIKYQIPGKNEQLAAIHSLERHAAGVTSAYPDRAEPKIWEGIILSTDAGIVRGISALGTVKKAKELFEASIRQNPRALDGSAYTSLGSLYYQVPGWPVAFGDDKKAEKNLKTALKLNPYGIDPNFFYGDFLLKADRPAEARQYLERALMAPDRPDRALADAGRRQEIKARLAEIPSTGKDGRTGYN